MPVMIAVTIPGEPVSKERPRFNPRTGRAITPAKTKAHEAAIGWEIKAAYPGLEPMSGSLLVRADFYICSPARRDVDNMVKLVLDACNDIAFGDDSQVVSLIATVIRVRDDPRTQLTIRRIGEP